MNKLIIVLLIFGLTACGNNYPEAKEIPSDNFEWLGLKVDVVEYKSSRGRTLLKTSTGNCYLGGGGKISQVDCFDFGMDTTHE